MIILGSRGASSGKRSGVGKNNISREDKWLIESYQKDIERENKIIPAFIKEDMTRDEIRNAVIAEVKNGNTVMGITPQHIDARFSDAKDSRFQPIIDGLNNIRTNGRSDEDFYISRVVEITSNYSTRDIRKFIQNELNKSTDGYRSRQGYETKLGLILIDRFNPTGVVGRAFRDSLKSPDWPTIDDRIGKIKQAIDRRSVYRRRISNIQEKYRK